MKKHFAALVTTVCLSLSVGAALADQMPGHSHGPETSVATAHEDVKTHGECLHCGMDREIFSHSRMLVTYADGTSVGTCSIHCVVTELNANKGKGVKSVEVGDFDTRKLIVAEKAFWVIGGDKRGVMTSTPKWAFGTKEAAEAFIGMHGGKQVTYKEALDLVGKP